MLNEVERAVFLACVDIISLHQLKQMFKIIPEYELIAILQSFEQYGLVFVEDDYYLCLPLRLSVSKHPVTKTECQVDISI
jgi:hypothetical protein